MFEDDYLAVIHKPAGIVVSGNTFKTVAHALVQNLQPSKMTDATKPQPAHRLDFATTGILLIGKTSSGIRALAQLFEDKKVRKIYYVITIGEMQKAGTITTNIDGKQAHTNFQLIASVASKRFDKLNLVKLDPKTGRRHQLLKHLASIGNPILGDKDYGIEELILNGKGLYLHAYSLSFKHPYTQKNMYFEDKLPKRFGKIVGPNY